MRGGGDVGGDGRGGVIWAAHKPPTELRLWSCNRAAIANSCDHPPTRPPATRNRPPPPPTAAAAPHLWLQLHLAHVRLRRDDLVLGLQRAVGLVLEVPDRAGEVEVAVDAADAADLREEAAWEVGTGVGVGGWGGGVGRLVGHASPELQFPELQFAATHRPPPPHPHD